jgi:hypothetical protein
MPCCSAGRHLVGADVEAAVDGGGITADDFTIQPVRERDAEGALAGRRRADDRDQARHLSRLLKGCHRQGKRQKA